MWRRMKLDAVVNFSDRAIACAGVHEVAGSPRRVARPLARSAPGRPSGPGLRFGRLGRSSRGDRFTSCIVRPLARSAPGRPPGPGLGFGRLGRSSRGGRLTQTRGAPPRAKRAGAPIGPGTPVRPARPELTRWPVHVVDRAPPRAKRAGAPSARDSGSAGSAGAHEVAGSRRASCAPRGKRARRPSGPGLRFGRLGRELTRWPVHVVHPAPPRAKRARRPSGPGLGFGRLGRSSRGGRFTSWIVRPLARSAPGRHRARDSGSAGSAGVHEVAG
jgi:hypothetical protein